MRDRAGGVYDHAPYQAKRHRPAVYQKEDVWGQGIFVYRVYY